jgi:hypothetical protein
MLLPAELRLTIYDHYLNEHIEVDAATANPAPVELLQTSRLINNELGPLVDATRREASTLSIVVYDFGFTAVYDMFRFRLPREVVTRHISEEHETSLHILLVVTEDCIWGPAAIRKWFD